MARHSSHLWPRALALPFLLFAISAMPGAVTLVQAQDEAPTYTSDVAPIMQEVCQKCHVEGGLGPMPLTTYQQVRRWAQRIKQETAVRHMPPWGVDPTIGIQHYKNNIALSEQEIDAIVRWVDGGTPEGDPDDLPAPPADSWDWTQGWELEQVLGPPDMVLESGPIPLPAAGQDRWPDVTIDWPQLSESRYLRAAELRNTQLGRRALHHNNVVLRLEDGPSGRIVGAGAGKSWDLFAEDTGILLGTGPGQLNWGMHYALIGQEFVDSAYVALWFYPEGEEPEYQSTSEYHQLIDQFTPGEPRARDILVPPHGTQTLTRVVVLDQPIMINSIRPHMHLQGVAQSVEVIWPERVPDFTGHPSSPGEVLTSINSYDHNWQLSYSYEDNFRPLLPKGTALLFRTQLDNTESNPLSVDPDQWVAFGGRSVDAMSHMHMAVSYLTEEQYQEILEKRMRLLQEGSEVWLPEPARDRPRAQQ
jgi:hypothetical protein